MNIIYDPSEARLGTKMPQSVIRAGKPCAGLEQVTGADWLISVDGAKVPEKVSETDLPALSLLKKHLRTGLLVQRKTGMDFIGSIPKLSVTIGRMLKWTNLPPWLLIIGHKNTDVQDRVFIDRQYTGKTFSQVEGALRKWQLRGGGVTILERDELTGEWINGVFLNLIEMIEEPIKSISLRPIGQTVIDNERPWMRILHSLPGMSGDRGRAVADFTDNLADAISFLTDYNSLKLKTKIPGIGQKTIQSNKELFGLKDDECLGRISQEDE